LKIYTRYISAVALCYFLLLAFHSNGQVRGRDTVIVIGDRTDIDALFRQARTMGGSDNNDQARRICQKILEKKPDYYEVRTYLGRTYAWEKDYDNARTELGRVLIEKENDLDALSALIDVETWSGNYDVAMDYLKLALTIHPTNEDLLIKRAKIQIRQENKENAALTLRRVLDLNPGNKTALNMMVSLESERLNNSFQIEYNSDFYDKELKPQQAISGQLGRSFRFGSVIMRGNAANRFGYQGLQYEIESYLHFTTTSYADIIIGSSQSRIFPEQNYVAEIYQKMPLGFELSGGLRHLKFTQGTNIYTMSVGNYFSNYWGCLRMFFSPRTRNTVSDASFVQNSSQTYILRLRRYISDADHFIGIRMVYGESPDDRRLISQNPTLVKLTTWQAGAEIQLRAFGKYFIQGDVNYANQEVRTDVIRQRLTLGVQLKTNF
jgi:YaiO family outer membrane protein